MRYLIEIHHGIGDVVQMTGVVDSILLADPKAEIDLVLNKDAYRTLFENDDRVTCFYTLDMTEKDGRRWCSEVRRMRTSRYDYFFMSPISNRTAGQALALLVGAASSCGEQFTVLSRLSGRYLVVDSSMRNRHIVERNFHVLSRANLGCRFCAPRLCGMGDRRKSVLQRFGVDSLRPAVAICVGTSLDAKEWPFECYLELAKHAAAMGYDAYFIGGSREERRFGDLLVGEARFVNFMGKTTLFESAAVVGGCDIAVGGDTGMMHIGAALGVTTLALFGPTDPMLHAPYSCASYVVSSRCSCVDGCEGRGEYCTCEKCLCMPAIGYEEVARLFDSIVSGTPDESYRFKPGQLESGKDIVG